jgi:hypothetical protein
MFSTGMFDILSCIGLDSCLYQPENSLGQLVCRVFFFSCGEFSHCGHKKKKKKTQCELYIQGLFFWENTYKSGHIMRPVLVDDRQLHLPHQKWKKTLCCCDSFKKENLKYPVLGSERINSHQCTSWPFCPLDGLRFLILVSAPWCWILDRRMNTILVSWRKHQSSSGNCWVLTLDPR